MATNQTSYVAKLLYWNGPGAFEYTLIFKELIVACKVFIDIGANTGYYSLLGVCRNHKLHVHAFEPAQGPLYYLRKNTLLNNYQDKISIHAVALSFNTGEVNFYEVRNKKYSYLPYNLGGVGSLKEDKSKSVYTVKTETLDHFINQHSIETVDLIKIDTEGTENLILEGAAETIRKFLPIIICETLFSKIEDKLEAIMKKHDYLFFNHENGTLKKVDSLIRLSDNGVRDCFFVHPSKRHLIEKFIKP